MKNPNKPPNSENLEILDPLDESINPTDLKGKDFFLNSVAKYDILIISDNSADLEFYKQILLPTYNLYFAENLQKTKNALLSFNNINLVIIDSKDFTETINFIHNNSIYYTVPTVVCTENSDHKNISLALSNNAFDVWKKPLNPDLVFFRTYNIINRHSMLDKKTGLFSQESFLTRTEKILSNNQDKTYYIVHYDIDNFKIYNHSYGIDAGDELLQYIGKKSNCLSTPDSIFSRWDKDHFVALIEERYLSSKNIIRYLTQLEQDFHPEYKLSIRMGLYKITDSSIPIIQMCDKALMAHKFSKTELSTLYAFYDERVLEQQVEEQKITDEMENALTQEQFEVFLQPQYNQATMNLYGAEALVRWNHPDKGLISPAFFIPVFEKNGFILKLDKYIFRKVCQLQRQWLDEGLNIVPISVNLSRAEVQNENLCKELVQILEEYHLSTKYVNLEITESAYIDNPYQVINLTKQLQDAGFELEMDDFGSGYSSLNTLKDIPVNVLKLDLKFLYGDDNSNRTTKILSSVIRMAHGMSMPIIAEGVETKEQANFLKSLGCFYIQGFYFDRPMPSSEFSQRLKNYLPDVAKRNRFLTEISDASKIDIPSLLSDFVGPAAILEYDGKKAECARCNSTFYDFFDFSPDDSENYQFDLEENLAREDFEFFINTLNRTYTSKEICDCELKLLPKPNSNRPTWIKAKVAFIYRNNSINTFYIRVEDIDAEKAKEQRILNVKNDIYALSDCLPGGTLKIEFKNDVFTNLYANEGIATMLGYSLTQYFEKTKDDVFYFVHPEDKQVIITEIYNAIQNKEQFIELPYRLIDKNKVIINVHIYCNLTYNLDGSANAVVAVLNSNERIKNTSHILQLRKENKLLKEKLALHNIDFSTDISQQEQAISKTKQEKEKTKTSPFAIERSIEYEIAEQYGRFATFKYSMIKDKLIQMSDSLPKLFGYTREEFYKKFDDSLDKFIWKDDSKITWAKINKQIDRSINQELCIEHRVQTKSGELKWVRSRAKKIVEPNGTEYFVGTVIDIDIERSLFRTVDAQKFTIDALENNTEGATVRWKISGNKWLVEFASKTNVEVFGRPLEELLESWENNAFSYAHPDDIEYIKKETKLSIKSNSIHIMKFRIVKPNGQVRWLKSRGKYYPLSKNDGYFIVTCVDITDQLDLENQLFEEKQNLQNLIDALPGGIAVYEIRPDKLKVQYVSSKACQMFGKTKDEFINAVEYNKDIGIFEKDAPNVLSAIKQLELTGEPFDVNFRVKHKDGYLIWATVNAVKTGTNHGNPTFIAVYQNKTNNTTTLDQILSKFPFYVVVFDADKKDLLYANPQAEILVNKHFDAFEPINISEFLFDKEIEDLQGPIPKEFDNDEYFAKRDEKKLLVKRFRIDWNGHDAIFVLAEEIFEGMH